MNTEAERELPANAPGLRSGALRIAIFTTTPDLLEDTWGSILRSTPGVQALLLCVQVPSTDFRSVLKRFRNNLRKHGILFLPYRTWAVFAERHVPNVSATRFGQRSVEVDTITCHSIHSDQTLRAVRDWAPDVGISIGAPVLRDALFSIPKFGTLNVHCGEVPAFRGAPPAFWELYMRASRIGATFHRIDQGLDTGRIIDECAVPLYDSDTLQTASARAFELGQNVFERGLLKLISGVPVSERVQPGGGRTF